MKPHADLKAWCHWKRKEKDLSEDDALFVKAIEDVISEVGTWKAKYEQLRAGYLPSRASTSDESNIARGSGSSVGALCGEHTAPAESAQDECAHEWVTHPDSVTTEKKCPRCGVYPVDEPDPGQEVSHQRERTSAERRAAGELLAAGWSANSEFEKEVARRAVLYAQDASLPAETGSFITDLAKILDDGKVKLRVNSEAQTQNVHATLCIRLVNGTWNCAAACPVRAQQASNYRPTKNNEGSAKNCPGCGYPWSDHVLGEQGSSVCEPKAQTQQGDAK